MKDAIVGFIIGLVPGLVFFATVQSLNDDPRAQLEREIEQWRLEDMKQLMLEDRRREFMDQMEKVYL